MDVPFAFAASKACAQAGVLRAAAIGDGRLQSLPLDLRLFFLLWGSPPLETRQQDSRIASKPLAVAPLTLSCCFGRTYGAFSSTMSLLEAEFHIRTSPTPPLTAIPPPPQAPTPPSPPL